MNEDEITTMVALFLTWPLPADVCADEVACRPGAPHRTGTSLLTATQARSMIEHVCAEPLAELAMLRSCQLGPVPEGALMALGAWLASRLDEDEWPGAERYLNAALAESAALRAEALGDIQRAFALGSYHHELVSERRNADDPRKQFENICAKYAMIDSRNLIDLPTDQGCA